jgi:aldehyde dehydrogenase (NAD+)
VQLPLGGVKKSGNCYPSAREVIKAVTERTTWTLNNFRDIQMVQGFSADIKTEDD